MQNRPSPNDFWYLVGRSIQSSDKTHSDSKVMRVLYPSVGGSLCHFDQNKVTSSFYFARFIESRLKIVEKPNNRYYMLISGINPNT
jgi:hypothetical protein